MSEKKPLDHVFESLRFMQDSLCVDCAAKVMSGGERLGLLGNTGLSAAPKQADCALNPSHDSMPIIGNYAGVSVACNDSLPAQTMIVSRDLFELLKAQGARGEY